MPYFADRYSALKYPIAAGYLPGLRNAQLGAIHAVAAHLTLDRREPAVVVLPTGSGKTAVLMATPYLARSKHALVLTPSVLVRAQIAEDFKSLTTLKRIGVLALDTPVPKVQEITGKLTETPLWEGLRSFDVVVGTPNSLSPDQPNVTEPPVDLFDLVLVDEAHHAPAKTWTALLERFRRAARILFTATPYRRDRKEIGGRFVYEYSVRRAQEDGIFGDLEYVPVYAKEGESNDVAIAKAAEAGLRRDREAGLDHCLMVRTDLRTRATELASIYSAHTTLRLRTIHSGLSLRSTRRAIALLKSKELDGIVCVNMLGEGFDFPPLKLAAVHVPHRSLEVTLQFIGRFARTGHEGLGTARFFAVPSEIEGEVEKLYREGAGWTEIVRNLSSSRIEREQRIRDSYEKFESPDVTVEETKELPLGVLRPYFHVKIYKVAVPVDIEAEVTLPDQFEVIYRRISREQSAAVLITRETVQPPWSNVDLFARVEYDLVVIYYDEAAELLFLNSSRRTLGFYEDLAKQYSNGAHRILPLSRINHVLAELEKPEFFNIGMKNVIPHSQSESYRIITGPRAHEAIRDTDGRLYHRGHAFGKFDANGVAVTLGYSSASKVWANHADHIPELIYWCKDLARKIASSIEPRVTGSGFDALQVGVEVESIPRDTTVVAVDWDEYAYRCGVMARYRTENDGTRECLLVDLSLETVSANEHEVRISIAGDVIRGRATLRIDGGSFAVQLDEVAHSIILIKGTAEISLGDFLKSHPFDLYLSDFSRLHGAELFRAHVETGLLDERKLVVVDWLGAGVNIMREATDAGDRSIHDHLRNRLSHESYELLVYDHRSGEIADFVGFRRTDNVLEVELFHCKAAHGPTPAARVEDVYEVCAQVVRSIRWLYKTGTLCDKLQSRTATGSEILVGSRDAIGPLLEDARRLRVCYRVILVQPGLSKTAVGQNVSHVIAAASDYLARAGADFALWISP
ncbi:MAG TPA: DEAD/DEAH box helicase family protein [Acidobacteriota bacterium]|nr:DEAD/DEAH box helicase family protein [Acidobacteriota bacterium]